MACSLKSVFCVSGLNDNVLRSNHRGVMGFCSSVTFSKSKAPKSTVSSALNGSEFMGKPIVLSEQRSYSSKTESNFSVHAQASTCISRALGWWEKTLKPNMIEIHSAQELVQTLLNAGDVLVVVDFYSPGCGGCKALHPKICQIAEQHPNAVFLQVNYEELKTMCHSLNIHVLPFFRFYRGAEGRVCGFSCTNATIKKFKDAMAKHGTDRCSLGPAKGLDDSELRDLASVGEISINSPLKFPRRETTEDLVLKSNDFSDIWSNGNHSSAIEQVVPC